MSRRNDAAIFVFPKYHMPPPQKLSVYSEQFHIAKCLAAVCRQVRMAAALITPAEKMPRAFGIFGPLRRHAAATALAQCSKCNGGGCRHDADGPDDDVS